MEVVKFEDPTDFELTHHVVPGEPDRDHIAEMAGAYIVEFKRMRWSDEEILAMFRNANYAAPHFVYQERGEKYISDLLHRVSFSQS